MILTQIIRSKRGDEESAWSLRKVYWRGFRLDPRKNGFLLGEGPPLLPSSPLLVTEGFYSYELLASSVCFLSREVRPGGQSLHWASHLVLGASVSPTVRWQGFYLFLTSTYSSGVFYTCQQRYFACILIWMFHETKSLSNSPWFILFSLVYLSLSLSFPLVHGIPTVWESNSCQDSSQMPKVYLNALNIFK